MGFNPFTIFMILLEVDECSRNLHDCSSDEECIDLPYKFSCVKKCLVGFEMTGEASCIGESLCTWSTLSKFL